MGLKSGVDSATAGVHDEVAERWLSKAENYRDDDAVLARLEHSYGPMEFYRIQVGPGSAEYVSVRGRGECMNRVLFALHAAGFSVELM